ncbi:hypothetical protein [Desulfolithobacter sp.]
MNNPNDIWEALGELAEDEAPLVITRLFTMYEDELKRNPDSAEAHRFFQRLGQAVSLTCECNLNRR